MIFFPDWFVSALWWLQDSSGFPSFVNAHEWVWAIGEVLHFMGLCLLIGTIGTFDLRLLGIPNGLPIGQLQGLLPWGVLGFVTCLMTGMMFIVGNTWSAEEYLANSAFQWKMTLIALAGVNVLLFYATGIARTVEALGPGADTPLGAKVMAATSLILWLGVIIFGRFLPVLGDAF